MLSENNSIDLRAQPAHKIISRKAEAETTADTAAPGDCSPHEDYLGDEIKKLK